MNNRISIIIGLFLLGNIHYCFSQDTLKPENGVKPVAKPVYTQPIATRYKHTSQPAGPVDNSLNGQYNEVLKKIYRYQEPPVAAFHQSYMDTLNNVKQKLREAQNKLGVQNKRIATLQGDVNNKDQTLNESESKLNEVSFLGISVSKTSYNLVMWGLVLALGAALIVVIYLSASSRREAAYRIKLYDELSTEFQTHKVKANEKEKKLARELQTERNKLDELMNR